jgi:glycosyltransferase involved in cell wall biosynthesis
MKKIKRAEEIKDNMDNKQKRLLCIVGGMNAGGAETFLMKIYRKLDKTKYQMDFYVASQDEGYYEKEILSMGGKIFRSIPKTQGFIKSFIALKNTVRNEKYDYVMRVSQHSLSTLDLLAAKLGGARKLIYRSSNTGTGGGKLNKFLHILFNWLSISIPNIKIAPSTEAAEFMFGKNCVENGKARIIKNAIPVEKFLFNQDKRDMIRKELRFENKFIIGHVGRFNQQKNHSFLIDIFARIIKKQPNSLLVLVGKGELEIDIKKKIESLGLKDMVLFTGVRSDIEDILMSMDVFVFPSFFEGMPNTVIEAQATGLQCVISDRITSEAGITEVIDYLPLEKSAEEWAEKILEYNNGYKRENMLSIFRTKGYDMEITVKKIVDLIFR